MTKKNYCDSDFNPGAEAILEQLPDGQPMAIINLLLFKEWAEYPPGTIEEKLSGQKAYEHYSELSIPFVNEVGGIPMWRGVVGANLIGPEDEQWDEVLIMQYPSRGAFQRMIANSDYQKIVFHRTAAVKDSRLYAATSPKFIGPMKWKIFNLSRKLLGSQS